jgi:hypothetical protein
MKPAVGFKLPSAGVTPAPNVPDSKVQGLTLPKEA